MSLRFPGARRAARTGGHFAVLVFFVTFLAFPFYWMLITTFKTTVNIAFAVESDR